MSAQGQYIARMDADDICTPDRLAKQVSYLDKHAAIGLVGSAARLIHADGSRGIKVTVPSSPGMIRWNLNFGCPLIHPSVMMRRALIEEAGYYRAEAEHTEDYDLWVRVAERAELANLNEILLYYRTWPQSITSTHGSKMERQATLIVQRQVESQLGIPVGFDIAALLRRLHDPGTGQEPGSAEDIEQSARLVEMFTNAHEGTFARSPETSRIAADAALKLLVWRSSRHASRCQSLSLIARRCG
jgi:hypothetical protein